jgi:CSLREA domain-containing protein
VFWPGADAGRDHRRGGVVPVLCGLVPGAGRARPLPWEQAPGARPPPTTEVVGGGRAPGQRTLPFGRCAAAPPAPYSGAGSARPARTATAVTRRARTAEPCPYRRKDPFDAVRLDPPRPPVRPPAAAGAAAGRRSGAARRPPGAGGGHLRRHHRRRPADADLTDDRCDASPGPASPCTLRAAIQEANATPVPTSSTSTSPAAA